jgi:mannosyltransferase
MNVLEVTLKRPVVVKRVKPSRASQALIIASIAGAAALLDLLRIGAPSIWMDESVSIELARQPLVTLFAAYSSGAEPNMILYYLLLHGWLVFGSLLHITMSEAFIRFPSAVCAALASAVVYTLGQRFLGQFAALVAVVVYTVNGWQLAYAQEARSYSLQLLLVCLTWLGLLAALRSTRFDWRWWFVFVISGALSVYAQAISGLALVALGVAYGILILAPTSWRVRARRTLPAVVAGFIAIALLIAPFAYVSRHGSHTGWLPEPTLTNLLHHAATLAQKDSRALELVFALVLLLAFAVMALLTPWAKRLRAWLFRRDGGVLNSGAAPTVMALVCWLVIPASASYLISLGPARIFSGRYLIIILPALSLLVGAGVARIPWRSPRLGACVGCALVLLMLLPAYYAHAQVEDWRGPTRWLEQRYQPGDGLVSYNNMQGCDLPVKYYLWADGSPASFTPDSPGLPHIDRNTYGNPPLNYMQALDTSALAVFASHHPRVFFIAGRLTSNADVARVQAAQAWLDAHYHFVTQTSSGIVTIRLYDTSTTGAVG